MNNYRTEERRTSCTLLARWSQCSAQTAVPLLARTLTQNWGGVSAGRRAVQLRPFRMQSTTAGTSGRNMFVLRTMGMTTANAAAAAAHAGAHNGGAAGSDKDRDTKDEHMIVLVEDPTAPTRRQRKPTAGVGAGEHPGHTRWTCCSLATSMPTIGTTTSNTTTTTSTATGTQSSFTTATQPPPTQLITPFDTFLQRTLLSPQQGGGQATPVEGQWTPRTTAVSLEGFIFHVGSDRAAGGSGVGDWQVKVASVVLKGGAASGTMKGVIVEVSRPPRRVGPCSLIN